MSEAGMEPIIDAHHHIWALSRVPWLQGPPVPRIFGEYGALRRDYGAAEFITTARRRGVVQSVYIQINVAPGEEVEEVAWVRAEAARQAFPMAIVGYADLAAPDLAQVLDRQMQAGPIVGIRQQLHWHETPLYRFAARPDIMADPAWRAGLAEVARRGLAFDLQIFPGQAAHALGLVQDHPQARFILEHAGMLEDRSPAGWAEWRAMLRALAACPNIVAKLSGLGTFVRACTPELWRPVVRETLEIFGPERCLFGSNYPIELLWTEYDRLLDVMLECLRDLSAEERRQVMHDTARATYRL
ncbi:amidohydrolase family protein [Belnapia sp. T6]|uniref:Amidohydrolase family protein n=1 Tax=Belnapia mucosa TaxID=2804532 RepID=A0ABS1V7N9_9PROT|nr:amidohydrolase family protein [Belnapia mucosa]MBL6457679.1 amidohydrolase family protein [Belnapia mucosa]